MKSLHDISFHVKTRRNHRNYGRYRRGKTSIIQLLQRLYDATDGSIYVDDVNIRDMSLKQLRSNIPLSRRMYFFFGYHQ